MFGRQNFLLLIHVNVGIYLCRSYTAMSQQVLYIFYIYILLQQQSGKGMAGNMEGKKLYE